jgi:hypothetical protein
MAENIIDWSIRLASQINQSVRGRSRSRSRNPNRPHPGTLLDPRIRSRSLSADPNHSRQSILRVNQANPSEPVYPSISRFYQATPCSEPQSSMQPTGPVYPSQPQVTYAKPGEISQPQRSPFTAYRSSPQEEVHQISFPTEENYCYLPEEIYLSSVLPTRTPRELRHFQRHCWRIYEHQEGANVVYEQGINHIRRITTSPLNFTNLLWRTKTVCSFGGIIEQYCWIRRRTRSNNSPRVYLEPAYQVTYSWSEFQWSVTRLNVAPGR